MPSSNDKACIDVNRIVGITVVTVGYGSGGTKHQQGWSEDAGACGCRHGERRLAGRVEGYRLYFTPY